MQPKSQPESQSKSDKIQLATEYLCYRYLLSGPQPGEKVITSSLLFEEGFDLSNRELMFEVLKGIVWWSAASRYKGHNPALAALHNLREVYGATQEERVLDLAQDLVLALDDIEATLGLKSPLYGDLQELSTSRPIDTSKATPLCDLELDAFWGFEYLQRDLGEVEPTPKTCPLDVFYSTPEVEEAPVSDAPETPAVKPEGTFSRVYKVNTGVKSKDGLLELLMGEDKN